MFLDKTEVANKALYKVFGNTTYWSLRASPFTFRRGGHYKIELVGPNSPATFEKLLTIVQKENIPVHRVVGTLGGFGKLSDQDLKAIASLSSASGVEFIATPISPLTNIEGIAEGKHPSEGSFFGLHLRGTGTIYQYLYEMLRGVECGLRSFLIWDFGALDCVEYLKAIGQLPSDVTFKVSIFAGSAHAPDCVNWGWRHNSFQISSRAFPTINPGRSLSSISSINPVALPWHEFAALRVIMKQFVPFDIHITTLDSMGGLDRTDESHEIIRVASPVNVKIERGAGVAELMDEQALFSSVIPKVVESTKRFLDHIAVYSNILMEPVAKQ